MQTISKPFIVLLLLSFNLNSFTQEYSMPPYHGSTKPGDYLIDSSVHKSYDRESTNYDLFIVATYYYSYDAYGNVTNKQESTLYMDVGNTLKNDYSYSYDNRGFLKEIIDNRSQSYERYEYENNGNWIECIYGDTDGIYHKTNCEYDASALSVITDSIFRDSKFYEASQKAYVYDTLSNITKITYSDNSSYSVTHYKNTYDTSGLLTEVEMEPNYLTKHFYSDNNKIKTLELKENSNTGLMTDTIAISEWEYNEAGNIIQSKYYYTSLRGELYLNDENYHYYKKWPVNIEEHKQGQSKIKAYPIPANRDLYIEQGYNAHKALVKLYNLSGQLVLQAQLTGAPIDISGIPAGMYILNYICQDDNISMKIIVK